MVGSRGAWPEAVRAGPLQGLAALLGEEPQGPQPAAQEPSRKPAQEPSRKTAGYEARSGWASTRGANGDGSQLPFRPPPGVGRSSGPPDCDSRLPDCRIRTGPVSQRILRPKWAAKSSASRSRWGAWAGAGNPHCSFLVVGAPPGWPGPRCGGLRPPHRGPPCRRLVGAACCACSRVHSGLKPLWQEQDAAR